MDVQFTLFGDKVRIDPQKLLNKKLQIAQKIQENGYNPSDYHLNIEQINQQLQDLKAKEDYQKLLKTSKNAVDDDITGIEEGVKGAVENGAFCGALTFLSAPAWIPILNSTIEFPAAIASLLMAVLPIMLSVVAGAGTVAGFGQSVTSTIKLLVDKCKLRKYKSLTPTHPVIEKAVSKLKKEAPKLARL